jgi:hypothetical protein
MGSSGLETPDQARSNLVCHPALRCRVSRQQALASATSAPDDRLIYLGDVEGAALEVMAVELNRGALLVIHAMPLRERFRQEYEEAKKWRT